MEAYDSAIFNTAKQILAKTNLSADHYPPNKTCRNETKPQTKPSKTEPNLAKPS